MAVFRWSTETGPISPFNFTGDVLRFDNLAISANSVLVQSVDANNTRFSFGGKSLVVAIPTYAITTTNVIFDNGSQLWVGDNEPSPAFDNTGGTLVGGAGNDQLLGDAGGYNLSGGGGNDLLIGGNDPDTLDGGTGNDRMFGGPGDDLYFVDSSADVTAELAGQGTDHVISTAPSYTLYPNAENLDLTDAAVTGAGNPLANTINGTDSRNYLYGYGGDDHLTGFGGGDVLIGGPGADVLDGGAGFDYAHYGASVIGLSIDLTSIEASTGEAAGDEWGSIEAIIGSAHNDNVLGNGEDNWLVGANGDDQLRGNTANDVLYGGNGADFLDGGVGIDQLYGEGGNDTFFFDTEQANGDIVRDFAGNGALAGDQLVFNGYGSPADGATFVQLDATHWQIVSAGGTLQEILTFPNAPAIHSSDYTFI
ncbi:MAG TPA: calcium-binding protein [Burkholderiales bacterium]|nr:calcium-binding protein [Burkholderiales bacterium]